MTQCVVSCVVWLPLATLQKAPFWFWHVEYICCFAVSFVRALYHVCRMGWRETKVLLWDRCRKTRASLRDGGFGAYGHLTVPNFFKIMMNFIVVNCHCWCSKLQIVSNCIFFVPTWKCWWIAAIGACVALRWLMKCERALIASFSILNNWFPEKKTQQTILLAATTPSGRKLSTSCWTGFVSSQTTAQARNAFLNTVFLLYCQSNSKLWLETCAASNQILGPSLWHTRLSGLQGFCVYNACGGGTGSGLGCLMLERLSLGFAQWLIDPG